MLQKEKPCIKSRGVKNFLNLKIGGKCNLICLLENMELSSVDSEGQY